MSRSGRRCLPHSDRLSGSSAGTVARMNSSGMLIRMPAPSPVFSLGTHGTTVIKVDQHLNGVGDDLALRTLVQW